MTTALARTTEGRAVLATTTWNPDHIAWAPSTRITLAHKGTRDAVLVLTARNTHWTRARTALTGIHPAGRLTVDNNIATIIGISWWADGDTAAALAALPAEGTHGMADTVRAMIGRGTTAQRWTARIARIDPVRCIAFDG